MKQVNTNLSNMNIFNYSWGKKKTNTFPWSSKPALEAACKGCNISVVVQTQSPWDAGSLAELNRANLKSNAYKPSMSPGNSYPCCSMSIGMCVLSSQLIPFILEGGKVNS